MRVCLLLALAAALLGGCKKKDNRSTLDKVLERGILIVGTEPEFRPFEWRDENGDFHGIDMDMARELAKDLGVKVKFAAMEWTSLSTALKTGEIDVIISGMTATPDRRKRVSFSDAYYHTHLCLLVNADSGIKNAADVGSKRVVVKQGTTGADEAPDLFPDADITKLQEESACALDVVSGSADAFLYDRLSVWGHYKKQPKKTRALLTSLSKQPYAMAVKKDDDKFVARLNRFLKEFRADGRYEKTFAKYKDALPPEQD